MDKGQMVLGLTGGYLLGRLHKMRWALALAGAAAGRRIGTEGGGLTGLARSEVAKNVRDQLVEAGKSAAVVAASSRMEALSDRMQQRAAALRSETSAEEPAEPEDRADEGAESADDDRGSGGTEDRDTGNSRTRHGSSPKSDGAQRTAKSSASSARKREEGRTRKPAAKGKSGGQAARRSAPAGRSTGRG